MEFILRLSGTRKGPTDSLPITLQLHILTSACNTNVNLHLLWVIKRCSSLISENNILKFFKYFSSFYN